VEPTNPNAGSNQGSARGKKQKINRMTLCFHETVGCRYGINQTRLTDLMKGSEKFLPGVLFSGDKVVDVEGDWDDQATMSIVHDFPTPFLLKAIIPHVSINEP
jgi:hypothetical protein